MKHLLILPFVGLICSCSGVAPEAKRDESNKLTQPPFMEKDLKMTLSNKSFVEIYSTDTCPYCVRAKALLESKHIPYTEYNLTKEPNLKNDAISRSGGRMTVPQIFIHGKHIGGCTDLENLNASGELDKLLNP